MRKTIGRIAGPLGGLFIAFSLLTRLLITGEFHWIVWLQLGLGVAGVVLYATTAFDDLRGIATGRGAVFVLTSTVSTLALLGILAGGNYWVAKKGWEWDLTRGKIHTLSEQTQSLLGALDADGKITVTAFYRPVDPEYPALESLLKRYGQLGGGNFTWEFVDGVKNPQRARAMNVSQDSARIVFKAANGREARVKEISEEALTNALAELGRGVEKKVYFLTGHGEKPIGAGADSAGGLKLWVDGLRNEGYIPEELSLLAKKNVPGDALAVVVAGPQSPLAPGEVAALRSFAENGGRLVLMLDPGFESGLDDLVASWGVELLPGVVIDPASQEPLWAFTQEFSRHPIASPRMSLFGALAFIFPDARGVRAGNADGFTVTELFKTGPEAWGENDPFEAGGTVSRSDNDDHGPVPLAVAVSKSGGGEAGDGEEGFRAVVFGDSDFASNGYVRHGGNRDLALNTVQWLGGQESKITIRPKSREKSALTFLSKNQRVALSFFSLNLLPLLLVGLGLSVWSVRKSK